MNLLITNIFFCVVSIVLFVFTPDGYSYEFCSLIAGLFLFHSIAYFSLDDKKNLVCFEFFFAISFGLVNFVYPIVYFQHNPHVSIFNYPFNNSIINKSTIVAYVGYCFFLLGTTKLINQNRTLETERPFKVGKSSVEILFILTIVSFVLYITFGGLEAIRKVYSGNENIKQVGVYSYFNNLFIISFSLFSLFLFKLRKSHYLFYLPFVFIFCLLILSTGSRIQVLSIGLIIIVSYSNNVKRISPLKLLLAIFIGVLLLFAVVNLRKFNFAQGKWDISMLFKIRLYSFFDIFLDLIINNRNLYVLVDYIEKSDFTYMRSMLVDIFSPIPGSAIWLASKLSVPSELITAGEMPTYLQFGKNNSWGLGTNMIGEAYLAFGICGVLGFCFLLGHVIKLTYYASRKNIYAYVVYYLFISHAVAYPRGPIILDPRLIVWSLILVYFTLLLTKSRNKSEKVIGENNPEKPPILS
jgi:oligosaccharide repeat unit polymerase